MKMKYKWENLGCVLAIAICVIGAVAFGYLQNKAELEKERLFYENCEQWHREDWTGLLICDVFKE